MDNTTDNNNLPRPRAKRSYTTLPRFQGLKDAALSPVEGVRKHTKNRHSLHHPHFPHLHSTRRPTHDAPNNWQAGGDEGGSDQDAISRQQTNAGEAEEEIVKLAPVDLGKLKREREARDMRNEELRTTLNNLSELSMATTRRLDDIYYSILEKTSQLSEIVHQLQELSNVSDHFHRELEEEVDDLQTDIDGQIKSYHNFDDTAKLIREMEDRIKTSKDKATNLSTRLDRARRRVQALEVQEGEYQASVSRRFTIFWGALGGFAILVLSLLFFSRHRHPAASATPGKGTPIGKPTYNITSAVPILGSIASIAEVAISQVGSLLPAKTDPGSLDDPRLQLFQEL